MRRFAQTDMGLARASNQDAAFVRALNGSELLMVADGMGGPPAGHVASAFVVAAFEQMPSSDVPPEEAMRAAVDRSREAIESDIVEHPERQGMGSTVAAAVVEHGQAWIANVGDSRVYLWRKGQLSQLSEDHSVVAQGVREGWVDPAMARIDPQRHMLTRVIGGQTTGEQSAPFIDGPFELDGQCALLMVTDGVSGVLEDEAIVGIVAAHRGAEIARQLIASVHEAGAPDNIGIALLDERL
ncbi:MAG: protein phosphatase 2C domain-containing protein [Dehalococcoidia bacterium]|nr:protein phosphatase 2C domain-containing protein [Dehalococcoidia bacterium]